MAHFGHYWTIQAQDIKIAGSQSVASALYTPSRGRDREDINLGHSNADHV